MQREGAVPIGLGMGRVDDMHAPGGRAAGVQRLLLHRRGRRHLVPDYVQLQPTCIRVLGAQV